MHKIIIELFNRIKIILFETYLKKKYEYVDFDPKTVGWEGDAYRSFTKSCWEKVKDELGKSREICIHAYNQIIMDSEADKIDYSVIHFNKKYVCMANQILSTHENWVGIHIRRTDHKIAIKYSDNQAFEKKINQILEYSSNTFFYLATDDIELAEILCKKYGERIVQQKNKVWGRNSREGMESAIVDVLCLSGCQIVLGSYGSSYSRFAEQFGRCKLIICHS